MENLNIFCISLPYHVYLQPIIYLLLIGYNVDVHSGSELLSVHQPIHDCAPPLVIAGPNFDLCKNTPDLLDRSGPLTYLLSENLAPLAGAVAEGKMLADLLGVKVLILCHVLTGKIL